MGKLTDWLVDLYIDRTEGNPYHKKSIRKFNKAGYLFELETEDWWEAMNFKELHGRQFDCQTYDRYLYFKKEEDRTAALFLI